MAWGNTVALLTHRMESPENLMVTLTLASIILTLGSVRKVRTGRIDAMKGWRPAWQSVTNFPMLLGS